MMFTREELQSVADKPWIRSPVNDNVDELARQCLAQMDALKKYGRHRRDCKINPGGKIMEALGDPEVRPCSCGLDDALEALASPVADSRNDGERGE